MKRIALVALLAALAAPAALAQGKGLDLLNSLLGSSGGPKITRVARFFLIKDAPAFRAHLERLASLPDLRRLIVSHHEMITSDPAGTLLRVAATL